MAIAHLLMQGKGGVGKSFVASILYQYLKRRGLEVYGCDTDPVNNTGWLLRLELDRSGVAAWRTTIARIDREGSPHPDRRTPGQCWQRGMAQAAACER